MKHPLQLLLIFTSLTFASENNTQAPNELDLIFASSFEFVPKANVVSVTTSGSSNNYNFNIGISSPDISCLQYADWWEILDANGLIYRRILGHSHVAEQPFVRSGSPVQISPSQTVWIRAHMNNVGFGGKMFTGSVSQGFSPVPYANLWDASVEFEAPQVNNCAF